MGRAVQKPVLLGDHRSGGAIPALVQHRHQAPLARSGSHQPTQLESLLRDAGFSDVRVESISMTLELASAADYLQVFSDVAWKARVAALSEADLAGLKEEITRAVEPYLDKTSGRLRLAAVVARRIWT